LTDTPRTAIDRRMFRYVVPIDDRAHVFELWSAPVAFAAVARSVPGEFSVEFWAEHATGGLTIAHAYQVFGTGHPLPDGAEHVATCPRTAEGLVFHLYELTGAPQ
jgi:hypothetical protein